MCFPLEKKTSCVDFITFCRIMFHVASGALVSLSLVPNLARVFPSSLCSTCFKKSSFLFVLYTYHERMPVNWRAASHHHQDTMRSVGRLQHSVASTKRHTSYGLDSVCAGLIRRCNPLLIGELGIEAWREAATMPPTASKRRPTVGLRMLSVIGCMVLQSYTRHTGT